MEKEYINIFLPVHTFPFFFSLSCKIKENTGSYKSFHLAFIFVLSLNVKERPNKLTYRIYILVNLLPPEPPGKRRGRPHSRGHAGEIILATPRQVWWEWPQLYRQGFVTWGKMVLCSCYLAFVLCPSLPHVLFVITSLYYSPFLCFICFTFVTWSLLSISVSYDYLGFIPSFLLILLFFMLHYFSSYSLGSDILHLSLSYLPFGKLLLH